MIRTLLPELPIRSHTSAWVSPADGARCGGDWCDVLDLGDDLIVLIIGDVAGHGEPAATTMHRIRRVMLTVMLAGRAPAAALRAANAHVATLHDVPIVTAIVAVFDQRRGRLTFASAGHPAPLLVTRDGLTLLTSDAIALPLGIFERYEAREQRFAVPSDAMIVFYTDGITEHDRDALRGEQQLASAARHAFGRTNAASVIAGIVLEPDRGDDDAAVLVLRVRPRLVGREKRCELAPRNAVTFTGGLA